MMAKLVEDDSGKESGIEINDVIREDRRHLTINSAKVKA